MVTIDSVDTTAIIEAQRNWLCERQKADPANPILIKAIEGGMPKRADPALYNWVDHGKVWGKITTPIYTSGTLLNEILIDPDSKNWDDVRDGVRKLHVFCKENDIPHLMGFSGGKGVHFSIIFEKFTAGDTESSKELFAQIEKCDVDLYKTVRRVLLFEIAKRANVDLEKIGMDKKKINFGFARKGSQVREFGTIRGPGEYKTLITEIPAEKPEPYELPLVFPEKVEIWNIRGTEYYEIALDALEQEIEKTKNSDEYTEISDENFKDVPIRNFPCIDKLFKVGIRNGRYYAAVATVLMCQKCGISKDETKKHLTKLCKTFPGITQDETDIRINNALEMYGKDYHFSCIEIKETFSEHNLCDFSHCPIKEKKEEARQDLRYKICLEEMQKLVPEGDEDNRYDQAKKFIKCSNLLDLHEDEALEIVLKTCGKFELKKKWEDNITKLYRRLESEAAGKNTGVFTYNSKNYSSQSIEEFNLDLGHFKVTPKGIFKRELSIFSGEMADVQIASTPVVIVAIGVIHDDTRILFKLKIRNIRGKDTYVWKPFESLLNHKDVLALQKDGLHIKELQVNNLIDYFDKSINLTKNDLATNTVASSCGWKSNNTAFILGPSMITKDGITEIHHLDAEISKLYSTNGHIAEWARHAARLLDYPAARYKVYVACVPPLLKPLFLTSHILFQDLPTGNAKTITNWLAASMCGNPIEQQSGGNSTPMGIQNFIQYIKGLPSFLDETTQNPEAAKQLVYAVGNLTSRRKSTNDNTNGVVTAGTPETVLMMTGEVPIIDEKGRGGQDMRAQPLPEGIPEFVEKLDLISIGFRENYGHVYRLYIQKVIEYKEKIRDIYNGFLAGLPAVDGIQENRMKQQYAAAATAGFLLEKVFAEILGDDGKPIINPASPLAICSRYMEMNVVNKPFVADYIKALRCAFQLYSTNQVYFNEEDLNHAEYGWVRKTKAGDTLICFDEQTLGKYIDKDLGSGRYAAAVKEWQDKKIINVRHVTGKDKKTGGEKISVYKTVQIKVRNVNTTVLQIPISNFYSHLNISPDDLIDTPAPVTIPDINAPLNSANMPPSSETGFNQVTSVPANLNGCVTVPESGVDLRALLMDSMTEGDR